MLVLMDRGSTAGPRPPPRQAGPALIGGVRVRIIAASVTVAYRGHRYGGTGDPAGHFLRFLTSPALRLDGKVSPAVMWHHEHGALRVRQDRGRDASQ